MKRLLIAWSVCCGLSAWGQEPQAATSPMSPVESAPSTPWAEGFPSENERNLERARLTQAREQLENQYKAELKQCYQYFDVTGCRLQARDRRLEVHKVLRQQELRFNAQERKIHAEEARNRVADRNSEANQKEAEDKRAAAVSAAKDRAQAHAQKQVDHAQQGTKRTQHEEKQREAAQHKADLEKRLRERDKAPAAPLPVPAR